MAKLTKAQRRVLEYLRDHGPTGTLPIAICPTRALRERLLDAGLMERERAPGRIWTIFAITESGRSALSEGGK